MTGWIRRTVAALVVAGLALTWSGDAPRSDQAYAASKPAKDDLHLLAQLVCGEARNEPYEAKVAVAAVVLNRTEDRRFPNSVAGVVYQTHAFESVSNGRMYRATTPECYKAARAALAGWDPTYGSIFFFAPDRVENAFLRSRPQVRTIGRYIFAK